MTTLGNDLIGWTPRRWFLFIALALVGQMGLVYWLSDYKVVAPRRSRAATRVRIASPETLEAQPTGVWSLEDPTLLALVTSRGFSRSAWLTIPRFAYSMSNSLAPPLWLRRPAEELVDDFNEFLQTNLLFDRTLSGRLPPAVSEVRSPVPVVMKGTKLRIEGGLAGWRLVSPDLPRESEPILTNTVIRVFVDSAGITRSAALLSTKGVEAADQDALNFAKHARFSPDGQGVASSSSTNAIGLVSGTLVFQWFQVNWSEMAGPALRAPN